MALFSSVVNNIIEFRCKLVAAFFKPEVFLILLIGVILLFILLKAYELWKSKCEFKKKWGKRSIDSIKEKLEFINEIHFAASECGKDKNLILRCIQLLRKYPVAVNVPAPPNRYTPFLRACWNGSSELVAFMLNIGADIQSTALNGDGPIHLATYAIVTGRSKNFSVLKILLNVGCNINAYKNPGGFTALHLAARKGDERLVGWMLANGANPNPLKADMSPKHLALIYGHKKVASMLTIEVNDENGNSLNATDSDSDDTFYSKVTKE